MADLNALIAQGYQFQAPPDPFVQYAKRQQLDQGEQTNQLNQMKMQEYQRGIQQQNALNQAYASAADPTTGEIDYGKVRNAMAQSGVGSQIPAIEEARSKQENARLTRQKLQGEIESTGFEFKIKKANKAITDIASLSNAEEAIASIDIHVKNGDIDLNKATQLKTALAAAPSFGAWQKSMVFNILDAKERLTADLAREGQAVQIRGQDIGAATATRGQDIGAATATRGQDIGAATATRGQDIGAATAKAGQAVQIRGQDVGAATAKAGQAVQIRGQDLVNAREQENLLIRKEEQRRAADPAFQQQMADAKALGTKMGQDKVLRATQLPKVLDTAAQTLAEVDVLIGKRDEDGKLLKGQKPHPGFENAVGATFLPGARFVPGTDAANFQARFDQIKGGAFLQAFETLKGGGSITNVEGEKGTAALNRMSLAQSEKEFVQAAREFQNIVRTGVERAKKMAGNSDIDTLLEKYK